MLSIVLLVSFGQLGDGMVRSTVDIAAKTAWLPEAELLLTNIQA